MLKKPSTIHSIPTTHMGAKCNCTHSYRTIDRGLWKKDAAASSGNLHNVDHWKTQGYCCTLALHLLSSLPGCWSLVWEGALVWPNTAVVLAGEVLGYVYPRWAEVLLQYMFNTTALGALLSAFIVMAWRAKNNGRKLFRVVLYTI